MTQVQRCISSLMQTQPLRDWDLSIQSNAIDMNNQTVLAAPQIFKQSQIIHIDERVLRTLPIQHAVNLGHEEWIMVYQNPKQKNARGRSNFNAANNVYNAMRDASGQLGIRIEEPHWIELENEADMSSLEAEI